jgi:hypothetical protein
MGAPETERVRELLRGVSYTGFSRDTVGAGFVAESVTKRQARLGASRTGSGCV